MYYYFMVCSLYSRRPFVRIFKRLPKTDKPSRTLYKTNHIHLHSGVKVGKKIPEGTNVSI